jgi:hypothetical protein
MKNITVSRDKVELWLENLEYSDSDKSVIADIKQALAAPVQDLPFGVGGGLVAIKTLLSRDPCVHANTAIEMIDAILKEHPAAQRQWVGLTEQEAAECWSTSTVRTWQAIEAKLKEKNT